jgi:hypothetical protein
MVIVFTLVRVFGRIWMKLDNIVHFQQINEVPNGELLIELCLQWSTVFPRMSVTLQDISSLRRTKVMWNVSITTCLDGIGCPINYAESARYFKITMDQRGLKTQLGVVCAAGCGRGR